MILIASMILLNSNAIYNANIHTVSLGMREYCDPNSMNNFANYRAFGNKVDNYFSGYPDVWASEGAIYISTDVQVHGGKALPLIYEGVT